MGIFSKRKGDRPERGSSSLASSELVDSTLPDGEWFHASEQVYDGTWRNHLGSPETFAAAGRIHHGQQNFAVALLFYRKAIDLMHSIYITNGMSPRQPSARDLPITDGFISSLGATLEQHPESPVDESVREVTHRLRTISTACERAGLSAELYLNALEAVGATAPRVNVDDILW
jgi:hypothetical protein